MDDVVERVRRQLLALAVPAGEIDSALSEGRLELLTLDRLAFGPGRLTRLEVAAAAELPLDLVDRLWRALGFPSVTDENRSFTDDDVEALVILRRLIHLGLTDEDSSVHLARVMGSAMARVAEAEVTAQPVRRPTVDQQARFAEILLSGEEDFFGRFGELLTYVLRRHFQAAVRRAMVAERADNAGALVTVAVGFADLVGYTALSSQLSEEALGRLVSRFEELAGDAVTSGGGRVVKMIGDEVMFVVDNVGAAVGIALALADVFADDELLSDVRVGLAVGHVLSQDGDYYGPVVNFASRAVNVAYPGTVVVSQEVHDALIADPGLAWRSLRHRHLKGIGSVALWVVHRADEEPRTGRRRFRPLRTLLSETGFQRAESRGEA